ncbi:3-hexulose-6-phosphate isomerase [Arthrobacter sp. EpRS66]|nr:3-hexulose-6-phosphate isomerase [Arthrobacter sp. EpRS66]
MSTTQTKTRQPISGANILAAQELIQREITEVLQAVDPEQVAEVARLVRTAGRVFVAGAGRSGLALRMAAMRLMHLGMDVHVVGDTTTPAITSSDVLLVASGSGTTAGVVRNAQTAAQLGASIAGITTDSQSPLALLANAVIEVPAARKTDHGSAVSAQYSGSLFEQALLLITESLFHSLWDTVEASAEELWLRHANLE